MSIFSRSVAGVSTADLQQLLNDGAVENVRLEFKREAPTKDEILKKVSSFANTFGGLIVVGAEAENDGRLRALRGIPIQPSYKQTIVQWCTSGAMPPITVEVSDPIPSPEGGTQVCYVIAVAESEQAPHFLNGRKGVYIRTDEFSSKFEPRLATGTPVPLRPATNNREPQGVYR
jgi:predicted HTH transcriptional regulator